MMLRVRVVFVMLFYVFFFKQKTAYEMRISDWSSACALPIYANAIVDSVSAEDVGKFPNTNVAEALTLVPGVTVDRQFGQGDKVSILGTDPALNRTLLDGQTVASADWFILDSPGRTFTYALLAPLPVTRVDVYNTPKARSEEGA